MNEFGSTAPGNADLLQFVSRLMLISTQHAPSASQCETRDLHSRECITQASHSIAFDVFLHFVTLWLWPLIFPSQNHISCGISQGHSLYQVWTLWCHSLLSYAAHKHVDICTDRCRWTLYSRDWEIKLSVLLDVFVSYATFKRRSDRVHLMNKM